MALSVMQKKQNTTSNIYPRFHYVKSLRMTTWLIVSTHYTNESVFAVYRYLKAEIFISASSFCPPAATGKRPENGHKSKTKGAPRGNLLDMLSYVVRKRRIKQGKENKNDDKATSVQGI